MSSLKRSAKNGRRIHRERPQPTSRAHLGLLEKKKDYKRRAEDYNRKKAELTRLHRRALNRNPDEFHYHMIRSRLNEDGAQYEMEEQPDEDAILQRKLGNLRDLNYVKHRLNLENQKIEKMKAYLHFADFSARKNMHTIFVDDEKEAKCFDPSSYFDTPEELLNRSFNRPRNSRLKDSGVQNAFSKTDVKDADHERRVQYKELLKRMERARELKIVIAKLEVKKNLVESRGSELKPKKITPGTKENAPVYRWTYERKK